MPIVRKVKMKKSEIKRDRFLDGSAEILEDIKENWRKYFIIITVSVLVLLLAVYVVKTMKNRGVEATQKLFEANDAVFSGAYEDALLQYEQIRTSYYGTAAAKKALFYAGFSQLYMNKYDESINYYKQFLKSGIDVAELRPSAYIGIGRAFEGKSLPDSALYYYSKMLEKYPNSLYAPEAYISSGRVYEMMNEINKAVDSYEKVIYLYPNSEFVQEAIVYKNMLEGAIEPIVQMQQGTIQKQPDLKDKVNSINQ